MLKLFKRKQEKKFKAKYICHECGVKLEKDNLQHFKTHLMECPFCGNKLWLYELKDKEYWLPKIFEEKEKTNDEVQK